MALADLIARGAATAAVPDFAGAVQEGVNVGRLAKLQNLQAQGLAATNQAHTLANLATQRQQEQEAAQRAAMNQNVQQTPEGLQLNEQGYLGQLAAGGFSPLAMSEQMRLQQQKLAAVDAKIKQAKDQHKAVSDVLYGVNTPMDFAAALPVLEKMGVNTESLRAAPYQSNWREVLDQQIRSGMDAKQKIDAAEQGLKQKQFEMAQQQSEFEKMMKGQQFGLEQTKATEQARHNKASEGTAWYSATHPAAVMAGGVTKAPPGYRFTPNGDLEAIPGGPADAKKIATDEKARMGAQKATDFAEQGIGLIDNLLADPGLKYITGFASKAPIIPGTSQARADAMAQQIEGQTFLQAFQSLKGAGAITETEGKKATAAIARLNRNQSKGDYSAALKDLKSILETTKRRNSGTTGIPTIKDKAGYDALPVGAAYKDENGGNNVKGGVR